MMPAQQLDEELGILFGTLCDGLRQEVRSRQLVTLASKQDVSLTYEREAGIAAAMAFHLRSVGFLVQVESYVIMGAQRRRPDLRIWLPASEQYLYLELKTLGWGEGDSYDPATIWRAIQYDLNKLSVEGDAGHLPNGLVVTGFSKPTEARAREKLSDVYMRFSKGIIAAGPPHSPYEEVGVQQIDLLGMDTQRTSYSMLGLWVRKPA